MNNPSSCWVCSSQQQASWLVVAVLLLLCSAVSITPFVTGFTTTTATTTRFKPHSSVSVHQGSRRSHHSPSSAFHGSSISHSSSKKSSRFAAIYSSAYNDNDDADDNTSPLQYIRWQPKANNDNNDGSSSSSSTWQMQTAVTTFQHPETQDIVELHAQLHYGDKPYYEYYNTNEFNHDKTAVLYELLLDQELLLQQQQQRHHQDTTVQASPNDQLIASQYGWTCQVDGIDYNKNNQQYNWIHADFTRQELQSKQRKELSSSTTISASKNNNIFEAATAALFMGPAAVVVTNPQRRQQQQQQEQRQQEISRNAFAQMLRSLLWMTVPSPELFVLVLDSNTIWMKSSSQSKGGGGGGGSSSSGRRLFQSNLSPTALPLLQALAAGQMATVRKLLFGQVIVSSNNQIYPDDMTTVTSTATNNNNNNNSNNNNNNKNNDWDVIVTQRNDKALRILQHQTAMKQQQAAFLSSQQKQKQKYAILYGCSHCPDLHQKLIQQQGYVPISKTWRTAWSVRTPGTTTTTTTKEYQQLLPLAVLLSMYLGIGGLDWIATMEDMVQSYISSGTDQAAVDAVTYLIRHVLLYVAMSNYLLDWKSIPKDKNNKYSSSSVSSSPSSSFYEPIQEQPPPPQQKQESDQQR